MTAEVGGKWLIRHAQRAAPQARLFCFSCAGMGASLYRAWPAHLPLELDVCAIQTPGRENRLREAPLSNISQIVETLLPALLPELDLPFAFFGHSMGALIAYETARALHDSGGPVPRHLFVSARRPPHVPGTETPISDLSNAEFLVEVQRRYGGIPKEILAEPEILALLLPAMRADFKALETHRPEARAAVSFGITAFGGSADALTPRQHLDVWRAETSAEFSVRVFAGDHFYLNPERAALLRDVSATLSPLWAGSQREVSP